MIRVRANPISVAGFYGLANRNYVGTEQLPKFVSLVSKWQNGD